MMVAAAVMRQRRRGSEEGNERVGERERARGVEWMRADEGIEGARGSLSPPSVGAGEVVGGDPSLVATRSEEQDERPWWWLGWLGYPCGIGLGGFFFIQIVFSFALYFFSLLFIKGNLYTL